MKPTLTYTQSEALAMLTEEVDIRTLCTALLTGWEMENPSISQLREWYQMNLEDSHPESKAWCKGVVQALDAVGYKIADVNTAYPKKIWGM